MTSLKITLRTIYYLYLKDGAKALAKKISGKLANLARRWMVISMRKVFYPVFKLRNKITDNRSISIRFNDVDMKILPWGSLAFDVWLGVWHGSLEIEFVLNILEPGMVFLDIGANVGLFTLAVAKRNPTIETYSFEPSETTYSMLKDNISLNHIENVLPFQVALSDRAGEGNLKINANLKEGLNTLGRPTHSDSHVIAHQTVSVNTLDQFMGQQKIFGVDLLKVDVGGAELLVFNGAKNLLKRPDAPIILFESYSWKTAGFDCHPVEIMWYLQDFDYHLFVLDTNTGKIFPKGNWNGYDAMMLAVKKSHPSYGKIVSKGSML